MSITRVHKKEIKDSWQSKPGVSRIALWLVAATSLLNCLALVHVNFMLAWLAFPFLFYAVMSTTGTKQQVLLGGLFGGISSLLLNAWMFPVVMDYAQGSLFLAIICWFVSAVVVAAFFGLQFFIFGLLRSPAASRHALFGDGLLMAGLWVVFEWLRAELLRGLPWLSYSVGITQGSNLYLMQPAAVGGVFILSFVILLSAWFTACSFYLKEHRLLLLPLCMLVFQFATGYLLFIHAEQQEASPNNTKVKVAFILAALPPEQVWNPGSANAMVNHLLSLNKQAAQQKPDLIVWSEGVVPWTYAADDDFLNEVNQVAASGNAHTLIGMSTAANAAGDKIWNSVYYLNDQGGQQQRSDKHTLLTFVERPVGGEEGGIILPFVASSATQLKTGAEKQPITTAWGKAGILICNESTHASLAAQLAADGASFLVNMGNDGWFYRHFITRQHFYNARFRAVENRRDIIINNNMGYAGVVRASGAIAAQFDAQKPGVQFAEVFPSQRSSTNPKYFMYFILAVVTLAALIRFFPMQTPKQALQ